MQISEEFNEFLRDTAPEGYDASIQDAWHVWKAGQKALKPEMDQLKSDLAAHREFWEDAADTQKRVNRKREDIYGLESGKMAILEDENLKLRQQVTLLSGVFSREDELNVHLRAKDLEIDNLKILLREVFETVNIGDNSYLCLRIMKSLEG